MRPLAFVNWSSVNVMFRCLMWVVAIVLAGVVVAHLIPGSVSTAHHSLRSLR